MSQTRVLVIDDSSTIRRMIAEALVRHGYGVDEASSMDAALANFSQYSATPARVVVTDIFMPGTNGLDGIALLRKRWPDVAVIAMSAGGSGEAPADALAAARLCGADAVLQKPFPMDDIVARVRSLIERRHPISGPRKRVLVVDDSAVIRNLIGRYLREATYSTTIVSSVEAAIGSPEIVGIDVVITDIFMPGVGGIEGIKIFRKHWPDCRIIAMSAGLADHMSSDKSLLAATKVGADGILSKPFSKDELFEKLAAFG